MTTTLQVIIDQLLAPVPGGIGRYTEELTRELIARAPKGCEVEGIVTRVGQDELDALEARLPGIARVQRLPLGRRETTLAWQHGIPMMGDGMLHAPSLFAPLRRLDKTWEPNQLVVTIHDVVPWTHPETLTPRGVKWHLAMAKRAERFADAVVVPTHAVAEQLKAFLDLGDRVRVIGGAPSSSLTLGDLDDQRERAERLGLPERYVVAVGTLEPRKGIDTLIQAFGEPALKDRDLSLVIVGPKGWGDVDVDALIARAGIDPARVIVTGRVDDADVAVALDRAIAYVLPSQEEGFGLTAIEAMSVGTPVIHTDVPALLEVVGEAGVSVPRGGVSATGDAAGRDSGGEDAAALPARLAVAIDELVADDERRERLGFIGLDRARTYSWADSADRTWQLHADI